MNITNYVKRLLGTMQMNFIMRISQDIPLDEYKRIEWLFELYELGWSLKNVLNDELFGFMKVDIEKPEPTWIFRRVL